MRVMVRTLRGERVALDVDGAAPVAQLKSMVMGRERIPVAMQRLFFAGRQLEDEMPLAHYGVQHDSVVFLSLRLCAADATSQQEVMQNVQMQSEPEMVKQYLHQSEQKVEALKDEKRRKTMSRRSLRKILSKLHVDVWTGCHDGKFLDLLVHHTNNGERNVGDLTADDWSAICTKLNAALSSSFTDDELRQRLGHFRREFDTLSKIKNHPKFSYDHRRRRVVAKEADWQDYILENPEAVSYQGKSPHFGRLRTIFSSQGEDFRSKYRESRVKRCLRNWLRNLGIRL